VHFRLAKLLALNRCDYERASQHFAHAIRLNPKDTRAILGLANILSASEVSIPQATAQFESAMVVDPTSCDVLVEYAHFLIETKKDTQAGENVLRSALSIDPTSAVVHHRLALLLRQSRQFNEARQHYEAALVSAPLKTQLHFDFGLFLKDIDGQMEQAAFSFKRALDTDPTHEAARRELDHCLALLSCCVESDYSRSLRGSVRRDAFRSTLWHSLSNRIAR
jgi:Tfp pilus assembly protein PilF